MQATGVQVPSAAPEATQVDGRVAYGGGLLNRRGHAVLRWFESSSTCQSFRFDRAGSRGLSVEHPAQAGRARVQFTPAREGGSSDKCSLGEQHARFFFCRRSSMAEHTPFKRGGGGSSPLAGTNPEMA